MQFDLPTGVPFVCAILALCLCINGLANAIRAAARDIADAKIRAAHEVANVIRGHSPIILRVREPHE